MIAKVRCFLRRNRSQLIWLVIGLAVSGLIFSSGIFSWLVDLVAELPSSILSILFIVSIVIAGVLFVWVLTLIYKLRLYRKYFFKIAPTLNVDEEEARESGFDFESKQIVKAVKTDFADR